MPLGPSASKVARWTLASAPSATERNPVLRLRSVFVGQRCLRVAQRAVRPDQPGERLLRDVLGIVGAEQVGQPHHLRVPGAEEPGDAQGRVIAGSGREAAGLKPGMQVCHAP